MKIVGLRALVAALGAAAIAGAAPAVADGTHGGSEAPKFTFGSPGKARDVTRTVVVSASDMAFHIEAPSIAEGETIRFVVRNEDDIDHDFTIGPPALQARHRAEMMKMMENGGAMANMHHDANAVYLKPGETRELIWTFRDVAGLEYACNVPGHYESGMHGRFRVDLR